MKRKRFWYGGVMVVMSGDNDEAMDDLIKAAGRNQLDVVSDEVDIYAAFSDLGRIAKNRDMSGFLNRVKNLLPGFEMDTYRAAFDAFLEALNPLVEEYNWLLNKCDEIMELAEGTELFDILAQPLSQLLAAKRDEIARELMRDL